MVGGERGSSVLTLTTESLGSFSLLDGRAWEMVSPAGQARRVAWTCRGGSGASRRPSRAEAVAYVASRPTESEPAGYSNALQVLSTRGPGGWSSRDISLPEISPSGASVGIGQEYRAFSDDLSRAMAQPFGAFDPSISPEASEQTPYLRSDIPTGEPKRSVSSTSVLPPAGHRVSRRAGGMPLLVEEFANVPEEPNSV